MSFSQSGMVLQSKPYKSHIYGYTNSDQEIKLHWDCKSGRIGSVLGTIVRLLLLKENHCSIEVHTYFIKFRMMERSPL